MHDHVKPRNWARQLAKGVISAKDMQARGWLDSATYERSAELQQKLAFRVPQAQAKAIDRGCLAIKKQFVPALRELETSIEELQDPIGDQAHSPVEGIVHRYPDRVLLKPTHLCASYCRYCFRHNDVSKSGIMSSAELDRAIDYIRHQKQLREVILTGGDPLTLTNKQLGEILSKLAPLKHIKLLRIHSRILSVLPERIDADQPFPRLRYAGLGGSAYQLSRGGARGCASCHRKTQKRRGKPSFAVGSFARGQRLRRIFATAFCDARGGGNQTLLPAPIGPGRGDPTFSSTA